MLLVVFKQFHHIRQVLNWILQAIVNKNVDIELLVPPVNLKDWLEALQEVGGFSVGIVNNLVDT